jgi:hypothetical protein
MSTPYIPARDADFDAWSLNFETVIAANPSAFGLASADATTITSAYNTWHAAYVLVTTPGSRTPPNVANKDVQKAAALVVFRGYANLIQSNQGVTNTNKAAAGLTIRSTGRTPIPTPGTAPIIGLVGNTPGVITFKYSDTATPSTKAKPFGSIQMEFWYQETPGTGSPDVANATYSAVETKSPFAFNTPDGLVGKNITVWGRWQTRRGLVGPWSNPLSVTGT